MDRSVITVAFDLHDGALHEFLPMIVENAKRSRTVEPACEAKKIVECGLENDTGQPARR